MDELLPSFSVKVNEGVDEVGHASTEIKIENDLVVEIEVQEVSSFLIQIEFPKSDETRTAYLMVGRVTTTKMTERMCSAG